MFDLQKELNLEQQRVVREGDGPCLVLAGAGSGKTRTITYRVAYLLEQGVRPENILLVTFTNKAAREMIERVESLVVKRRDEALPRLYTDNFHLPWSGTFHHIAYRILKKYASVIAVPAGRQGYKNNFSVLDSEDSTDLIKLCLKDEGIDRKEKRFPSPAVLQAIISYARNSETTIEDVLDLKYQHFLSISETLIRIAENYQKKKLEANVMDFDDLLVNWGVLLKGSVVDRASGFANLKIDDVGLGGGADLTPNPSPHRGGALERFAEQFQYILVDEYQDTNKIQASIIDLLASKHQNLLVVGDDAQSIYSFRAADIQNILAFEKKYPKAKIFKLETNYRSTPDILNLANNVISNNLNQYEKKLKSIQDKFTKPELQAFADQAEEAEFIVGRIEELQAEGVDTKNIAVLFRAAYHSQALEMELVKRGINYDFRGGTRFFERAHVKDVLAYLRIINNLEDVVAWRRVLNLQIGIGPAMAERAIEFIVHSSEFTDEFENISAQLSARAQVGWNDFLQVWRKLNNVVNRSSGDARIQTDDEGLGGGADPTLTLPSPPEDGFVLRRIEGGNTPPLNPPLKREGTPGDLIAQILDSKYIEYLENEYPDYRERMQDLEQLSVFANKAEDLNTFLAEATLQENFRSVETRHASSLHGDGEKIVLSTIHQAKGLEWEAVFVMGLSSGQFPIDRALRERNGLEEERRLFYVAVTRAKKYLYLTYSLTGGFGDYLSGPSMFLEEIDFDLIDKNDVGGGSAFDEVEYVDEDGGIRNTKDTELRNKKRPFSFLKSVDEL